WLSVGKKLSLWENGKEVFEIKHELGHLFTQWRIYDASGKEIGLLKHKAHLGGDRYKVKSDFGKYKIEGNFIDRTFTVGKNGHTVAEIHKDLDLVHDKYTIKVYPGENPGFILLMCIAIDNIRHHNKT
ncbi:unnamed protein product, partial [Didymodactylos carnosus]